MKIILISPYPAIPDGKGGTGLESYSANLTHGLAKKGHQVYVLSESKKDSREHHTSFIHLFPTWRRSWNPWWSMWRRIRKLGHLGAVVHIQQEIFAYGGPISAVLILPFICMLKLYHYKVVVTIHGVFSPKIIDQEFVIVNGWNLPALFVKLAFVIVYRLIALSADYVLVHDEEMRQTMIAEYGGKANKVVTITHMTQVIWDEGNPERMRQQLNLGSQEKVVLFFGFVAGYKGLDTLIAAIDQLTKSTPALNIRLIVAGGMNSKLQTRPAYVTYYNNLKKSAADLNDKYNENIITWYGFVEDADIPDLISSSDILVLPYRYKLASSGPMKWAFGYDKPLLVSQVFAKALPAELIYGETAEDLAGKLIATFSSESEFTKLVNISKKLSRQGDIKLVVDEHLNIYQS